MVAVVVGVVFAAPAAIRRGGARRPLLPFAVRLAARPGPLPGPGGRGVGRHHPRSWHFRRAGGYRQGQRVPADEGNLSDRQLLIRVGDPRTAPDPNLSPAARGQLDAHAATIAAALGSPALFTLDVAMSPDTNDLTVREPITVGKAVDANSVRMIAHPYVATTELLAHYGIDPAAIDDATDLLTVLSDDVVLVDFGIPSREDARTTPVVQRVDLPSYSLGAELAHHREGRSAPPWLASAWAAWLVESPRPLTSGQIAAARAAAGDVGLTRSRPVPGRTASPALRTRGRPHGRRAAGPGDRGDGGRPDPQRVGP